MSDWQFLVDHDHDGSTKITEFEPAERADGEIGPGGVADVRDTTGEGRTRPDVARMLHP